MKVSVVIPVLNQLELTKLCLDSIEKFTEDIEYEVIVVDNGSNDGTPEYLAGKNVINIRNPENIGVAKAWNQGVKASKGEYVCVINNDILVSRNWLGAMIDVYEKTENAGMVSPGTRWGKVDYDFESYSDKYIKKMKDVKQEGFAGWCMLIKKERFEKIGYFCEDYEIGIGEDTDYYLELKKNGYQSLITGVAFVHHFGSMTLDDVKETKGDEWEKKNIDKMNDKWGIQKETYLARKINNLIRTINRFFIKLFHGHLLSEKRNVHRKRHSNKK